MFQQTRAAEAPQSLVFVAEVEVFNPNLLGGDSDEGQLHLTYQGHQMGTGKMNPSSVPAQAAVKLQATMNLDLPLDFAAWLHGTTWQTLQAFALMPLVALVRFARMMQITPDCKLKISGSFPSISSLQVSPPLAAPIEWMRSRTKSAGFFPKLEMIISKMGPLVPSQAR